MFCFPALGEEGFLLDQQMEIEIAFVFVFCSFNVIFKFMAEETLQKDYEITSKNMFWSQSVQFWYPHHPALSNSLYDKQLGRPYKTSAQSN